MPSVKRTKVGHDLPSLLSSSLLISLHLALQYLRLSSRVDAVASRVETAAKMKGVTRSMQNIVVAMEQSMQNMNLEQITKTMDQFEVLLTGRFVMASD